MSDGTIKLSIEVDDGGLDKDVEQAGKQAGQKAGDSLEKGVKEGASKGAKEAKGELEGIDAPDVDLGVDVDTAKAESDVKSVGSSGKQAGAEIGAGIEQGMEEGASKGASSASSSIEGFGSKMKGALAGIGAAAALGGIASAIGECVEVANELQEDMGKLATAAKTNGVSNEAMNKSYRDMVGILGETDQSVEAVNHVFQLCGNNTEDLNKWTTIATGVYGTFGDSLPIEGLTEAANETAKVAQVTGPMADALNWASEAAVAQGVALNGNAAATDAFNAAMAQGMSSEDAFNAALQACSDEQERQALITNTLSSVYQNAADVYDETNGSVIAYRQAQSDLAQSQAEIGTALMPVIAAFTEFSALLLGAVADAVTVVGQKLSDFGSTAQGFLQPIADTLLPAVQEGFQAFSDIVGPSIGDLEGALGGLMDTAQPLFEQGAQMLGEVLPPLFQVLGVVANAAIQVIILAVKALGAAWEFLGPIVTPIIQFLVDAFSTAVPIAVGILNAAIETISGIVQTVFGIVQGIVQGIVDFFSGSFTVDIPGAISTLTGAFGGIPEAIGGFLGSAADTVGGFVSDVASKFGVDVPSSAGSMLSSIGGVPSSIGSFLGSALNSVGSFASGVATDFASDVPGSVSTMTRAASAIPGQIGSYLNGALNNAVRFASSFGSAASSAASRFVGNIVSGLSGIGGRVSSVGSNIVSGIWRGISSAGSWLWNRITSWANNIVSRIKRAFGIHSPSRVMCDEVGRYLGEGVGVGFDKYSPADHIADSLKQGITGVSLQASNSIAMTGGAVQQTVNFNQPVTTPDELARTMRLYSHYGLAGQYA